MKKVGIALGGGAARGIAHIGVLKELEVNKIPIDYISGTSIGAVVGALYAYGYTADELIKIVKKVGWLDFIGFHLSMKGLLSSSKIQKFLNKYLKGAKFKDLRIPFKAVATDVLLGCEKNFNAPEMEVALAARASATFPGIYSPVEIDDHFYIDGGCVNNVPSSSLMYEGLDFIIGVDVLPNIEISKLPNNSALITDRALDIMLHRRSLGAENMLLRPITEYVHSFDLKKIDLMIELGRKSVRNAASGGWLV